MNNKRRNLLIGAAFALFTSAAAQAVTYHNTYGATQAEAEMSMQGWANGRNVSYRCFRPSYGPPWMCRGFLY